MNDFTAKYTIAGTPSYIGMEGEGMQVVLDAIKEERSDDPARIRQFLSTIDQNHIRNGIIGKYYFDNNQHAIGDFFALLKIQDGQLVAVE